MIKVNLFDKPLLISTCEYLSDCHDILLSSNLSKRHVIYMQLPFAAQWCKRADFKLIGLNTKLRFSDVEEYFQCTEQKVKETHYCALSLMTM